jgi:hypothetical protein
MANALGGSTNGISNITSGTANSNISSPEWYGGVPQYASTSTSGGQNPLITAPAKLATSATPIGTASGIVDPAAAAAAATAKALAAARGDYSSTLSSTNNSINDAIGTAGSSYNSSILDWLDSQKAAQKTIDSSRVQNELARQQGTQDILDMVGNGIKSGGVILANGNSGSSSAGEALARAYGVQGRQQASKVGNQFAQNDAGINTQQDNLDASTQTELRHANEDKTTTINSIVNSARSQLAALNASAASASLPDRVDIEGRIASIKQQALDALSAYDAQLTNGAKPQSADQIRSSAQQLLTAGTAPESSFDYTTDVPAQFQDTGQFASSLPIFVSPNRKNTNQ